MSHPRKIWSCLIILTVSLFAAVFIPSVIGQSGDGGSTDWHDTYRGASLTSESVSRTPDISAVAGDVRFGLSCVENLRNRGRYTIGAGANGETFADCGAVVAPLQAVNVLARLEAVYGLCRPLCSKGNPSSPRSPPLRS